MNSKAKFSGGEGGIRTPDTLSGMAAFEAARFNHSRTSPHQRGLINSSQVVSGLESFAFSECNSPLGGRIAAPSNFTSRQQQSGRKEPRKGHDTLIFASFKEGKNVDKAAKSQYLKEQLVTLPGVILIEESIYESN